MNPWIWIFLGGIGEAVWAVSLNYSDGFSNIPWTQITIVFCFVSTGLLYLGLRQNLPVGAQYQVWVGCGQVLSSIAGALLFNEHLSTIGWIFLAILIAGILLVQSDNTQNL